jgi:hypothetical protein
MAWVVLSVRQKKNTVERYTIVHLFLRKATILKKEKQINGKMDIDILVDGWMIENRKKIILT